MTSPDQPREFPKPRRLSPAGVALIYAGVAGGWIIASGYLLTVNIADPVLLALAELGKGLAFVAATGLLLYRLLKGWAASDEDTASIATADFAAQPRIRTILLFVAMALVVPLIGLAIVVVHAPQTEQDTYANLQAVARLKSGQIENWLQERHGDAMLLASDPAFAALAARFMHGDKDGRVSGQVLQRFETLRTLYNYDTILLLDEAGQVLLAAGPHTDIPKDVQELSQQALSSKQVQRGKLFRDETGHVHLDWAVPVIASGLQERGVLVLLRMVPDHFLFPLIQTWPTASASAETLLARGEGDYVVFLNELRHRKGTALVLKLPLSSPALPAAIAVRANKPGTIRGLDHRGVEVLAAYQPVAGTSWHLVAKVDRAEVMMPVWRLVYWIGLVACAAVALIMAALLQLWRQQRYSHRLALHMHSTEAIEQSERRFRAITQSAHDAIITADVSGNIVGWNPGAEQAFGYTASEIVGQSLSVVMPARFRERCYAGFLRVASGGEPRLTRSSEFFGLRKDGSEFPVECSLARWETPEGRFCTAIIRDVSERKETEERLQRSQQQAQRYLNIANVMLLVLDAQGQVQLINRKGSEMLGYAEADILGKNWFENFIPERIRTDIQEIFSRMMSGNVELVEHIENLVLTRSGERIYFWRNSVLLDDAGEICGMLSSGEDITDRKRIEKTLLESEARYKRIIDELTDYQYTVRVENGRAVGAVQSPGCVTVTGYTVEEFAADPYLWIEMVIPEDRDRVKEHVQQILQGMDVEPIEHRIVRKDGELRWVVDTTIPFRDISGNLLSYDGVIKDITEHKQAEDRFRILVEQPIVGVYIIENGKLSYVNPRLANMLGYDSEDELLGLDPLSLVAEQDRDMVEERMRQRIAGEERSEGYVFAALRKDGSMIDLGVSDARVIHHGHYALIGLMRDLSEKRRSEAEIQRYIAKLETAFMRTVEVATTLSEMRDPYTVGHERRVSEIAVAIATELDLDPGRIDGIRVAGYLHDIGKISIPVEILSKPAGLSAIEYLLVQGHPLAGYNVLKDVDFPWPVADVVFQHHERLDGTGYPRGLKGDEILLETRIVSVADVIEAMASHRPYRAGLGVELALDEIKRGSGIYYDPIVVDACVRMYREKGKALPV